MIYTNWVSPLTTWEKWEDNLSIGEQITRLAVVLLEEYDGPDRSEGAIEMAARILWEEYRWLRESKVNKIFQPACATERQKLGEQ